VGVRCELRVRHLPPELPGALRRVPGVLDLAAAREDSAHLLRLTLREEGPVLAALLREIVESGADIYSCQTREVSLEEIYVQTLGEAAPAPAEVTVC
jgi:hypothetical protein